MAYDYMDPMGNYTGYEETDEERRKRLEAEATPVTQTIKTNPVTGEQEMTIKGTPQDLSAANPRTPTVTAPVAPDQVFQRQIQAESGGQHIDPRTGQILTSPKGAQGIAQIMPATAAQPGYGIRPATPEEIATKEGNMAFGERYKQGMLKAFGGDEQKATAAYNAGPNAIKRAEQQAQASGGSWTDYIPKETMAYMGKVFGNMIPSAQAGELTTQQRAAAPTITPSTTVSPAGSVETSATTPAVTPIAPTAQAQPAAPAAVSPYALTTGVSGAPGLKMPDAMQQQQLMEKVQREKQVNEFQGATANPDAMVDYMARKDVPDDLKTAMKINHFEALSAEKRRADVEQKVTKTITENPQQIPRLLNDKTEEGSIAKAFLYSLIGFKSGAEAEVAKMNLPGKWAAAEDAQGNAGMVLYSTSGKPLQGVNSDNTKMSPEQLAAFASGGLQKGVHVTKTETYIDPATGQVVSHNMLSNGKEKFTIGGKPLPAEYDRSKLVPEKQFTVAEDRRVQTAVENLRKNVPQPTEQQTLQALIAARVPNRRIEQEMGYAPGALGTGAGRQGAGAPAFRPAPTGGAVAPTAISASTTPATATPAQQQVALTMADQPPAEPSLRDIRPGERKDQYEAYVKQVNDTYKKQLEEHQNAIKLKQKDADEFSKKRFDVKSTLDKFREGITTIDSGNHNLGPNFSISGAGPLPKVQQFFGEQFGTDDSANTSLLRSLITRGGLEGIKNYMGPAISNFDVQTWMKNNPISESSPPAAIKSWLAKTHNAMLDAAEAQRTNAVKQGFVEPSFRLGDRIETGAPSSNVQSQADEILKRKKP